MMMRRTLVAFLLAVCTPSLSIAWGVDGHKAIARITLAHMSDKARQEALGLAGGEQAFIDASIWADHVRQYRRETAPWHYVNILYSTGRYDPAANCNGGDCVITRIISFSRILADRHLARPVRIEALKWLIHFVGDIHQPLHCANDIDRGGNDVLVRILGTTNRLHSWWDTGLVKTLGRSAEDIARVILRNISTRELQDWRMGTPEIWAGESFRIARDFIYAKSRGRNTPATLIILPDAYSAQAAPAIRRQIAKAGVRLAWILDRALR